MQTCHCALTWEFWAARPARSDSTQIRPPVQRLRSTRTEGESGATLWSSSEWRRAELSPHCENDSREHERDEIVHRVYEPELFRLARKDCRRVARRRRETQPAEKSKEGSMRCI